MSETTPSKRLQLSNVWRESRELVWARRYRLAAGLLLLLISRVAALVLPATSKFLVDDVIGEQRAELLLPLALVAAGAALVQGLGSFGLSQILGVTAQRSITELRKQVEQHIVRLPVSYFDSTKSGVLVSRIMNDAEGIRNLVGNGLVQIAGGAVSAMIGFGVLLYLNWRLTMVMIVVLIGFVSLMALALRRLRPLYRERAEIHAQVTGRLAEALGGIRIAKAYTAERREDLVFARGAHRLFRNVARTITVTAGIGSGLSLLLGLAAVFMMVLGGRAILAGQMSLGDFVMYVAFTGMMVSPLAQIASIGTQLSEAFAGLDRIREIQSVPSEQEDERDRQAVERVEGHVEFDGVTFAYTPGVPVLKDFTFVAPPGTTTALVGPSGSGKSTTISLVMGFHHPQEGRVLIDGRDLATLRVRDYRRHVGVVLQDNFLFDGTIAENIAYPRPHAGRDEVEEAGRLAHCDEFVSRFERGYDTVIGERGVKLSGGQRQRVAIARAILSRPRILILDEATSSLDSESEALIQAGLRRLRAGRTTFVIAHRLSTIRSADQILVLDAGEIVERGTHEELFARGGRYRELHDQQNRAWSDRFVNPGENAVAPGVD